jgi:hypothetical protein
MRSALVGVRADHDSDRCGVHTRERQQRPDVRQQVGGAVN